jgi:hypothetical protein
MSPSWEATSHSATQEIPNILGNLEIHYRVHRSPLLVPNLSQMYGLCCLPNESEALYNIKCWTITKNALEQYQVNIR